MCDGPKPSLFLSMVFSLFGATLTDILAKLMMASASCDEIEATSCGCVVVDDLSFYIQIVMHCGIPTFTTVCTFKCELVFIALLLGGTYAVIQFSEV